MQFKLEKMILIFKDQEKRELKFHSGVNIISGKSQTGKSALIDIIDYCLFSSNCTIPEGVISKNVSVYCIVVWINNRRLILARNEYSASSNPGSSRIYYEEKNETFNDNLITASFFFENKNKYVSIEHFKKHIKILLNLTTDEIPLDDLNDSVLSFRSMTSFMFQHQNLMANKYALFYRLDSFTKVKQTQRDLKIYMDIQDIEFLNIDERLYQIEKELKQIKKDERFINKKFTELINELKTDCITYYGLYGDSEKKILEILQFTNTDILNFKDVIKEINGHKLESNIPKELTKLEESKDKYFNKINQLLMQLEDIDNYSKDIISTKEIININFDIPDEQYCPLCNSKSDLNYKYKKAKELIKEEILELETLTPQVLEERENIQLELKKCKSEFKKLNDKFIKMKNEYQNIKRTEEKKEELLRIKTRIITQQNFLKSLKKFHDKDKDELIEEKEGLLKRKGAFDFETKLKQIEVKVSEYINEVINNGFDLEDSIGKPNLYFSIDDFSLFQQSKSRIYLSQMGSGSNWLNCHIALMLGLHKYISLNDSKIPSFLFFDQPSQVYFPSEDDITSHDKTNEESDLTTVKMIFKKIIENVNAINSNENCKSELQLFITDHVNFKEKWFTSQIIEDGIWSEGRKLVPSKYENN